MLTVHHLENSRSQRILWLLEELGLDYNIVRYERDPESSLAHYNLAMLCERTGRRRDGIEHYDRALENGVPPNPELEESLGRQ